MEQRCAVIGLELGVVEGHPVAEPTELAADDDRVPDLQPTLDEAPPEPRRIEAARLILEPGEGALDAAPEGRLDPQIEHADAGRDELPVGDASEPGNGVHLAQVLVPARDAKQEIAHPMRAEAATGASEHRGARQARSTDRTFQAAPADRSGSQAERAVGPSRARLPGCGGAEGACPPRLLGGDQEVVVGLPAVDHFDLGRTAAGGSDPAGERLGRRQVGAIAVVERDELEARRSAPRPP